MPEPAMPQTQSQPVPRSPQAILQALAQLFPQVGGMMGSGGGGGGPVGTPGRVGTPIAPFNPSQPGGSLPTAAATLGAPSQNQPQSSGPVPLGAYATGFHFPDKQARNAAVVTNALQGVTSLISQYNDNKQKKETAKAEGYFNQIVAAQQAGDQQTLALLLEDPKVIKTLEKGLNYFMPKVPGEPPPPEAQGIHRGIAKLGKMNQPGGVAVPRQPANVSAQQEIANLTAKQALDRLKNDPQLAGTLGLGTSLSGAEQRQAEFSQAGLTLSPAQRELMSKEDQRFWDKASQDMQMFDMQNRAELSKLAAQFSNQKDVERIHTGPLYERARIARDLGEATLKMKKEIAKGNMGAANKILMTTMTSQINNLRTNAEKAKKDGNDQQSEDYTKQADALQTQYDEARKAMSLDVDSIIEKILGGKDETE